jgi:GTP-binding protein
MSKLLKLAIVGRPNVGKSALFNRICKKNISIVDEAEGITRDRLYADADFFGMPFKLIDTGGINSKSKADFNQEIKQQAEIAILEADTIIMVVDSRVGMTALDKEVAEILLRTKKPVCLAVNKIDNLDNMSLVHEFYPLGISKMIGISALQGINVAELLEAAFASFSKEIKELEIDPSLKIAIIGRPNVGKSTFINYLLDEERCIVSPIAGTTRDSIDVKFNFEGEELTLIDTAGIRRKQKETEVVDKFAFIRTERAIERADVCVLILDATKGLTQQDKVIANKIEEAGKGCVLLFNKWDLVKGFRMEHCLQSIKMEAPFLSHCPTIFGSAQTGRNLNKILTEAKEVALAAKQRITTGRLNKFIEAALQRNHPAMLQGKRLRIYYMVQVDIEPPKFILFVNYSNLMMESYKKYLFNQFRETFNFKGVPLLFHLKNKIKKDRPAINDAPPKYPHEGYQRESNKDDDFDDLDDDQDFDREDEGDEFFFA